MISVVNFDFTVRGVKQYLKDLSKVIRAGKRLRKLEKNRNLNGISEEAIEAANKWWQYHRSDASTVFRHYHIAYCEFRGRTREQIENKTRTEVNEKMISDIKERMTEAMEKVRAEREQNLVCSDS